MNDYEILISEVLNKTVSPYFFTRFYSHTQCLEPVVLEASNHKTNTLCILKPFKNNFSKTTSKNE